MFARTYLNIKLYVHCLAYNFGSQTQLYNLRHVLLLLSNPLYLVMKSELHEAASQIYLRTVLFFRLPLRVN